MNKVLKITRKFDRMFPWAQESLRNEFNPWISKQRRAVNIDTENKVGRTLIWTIKDDFENGKETFTPANKKEE